jgi:hypothetical protein
MTSPPSPDGFAWSAFVPKAVPAIAVFDWLERECRDADGGRRYRVDPTRRLDKVKVSFASGGDRDRFLAAFPQGWRVGEPRPG